jgi:hypothetical protein
MWKNLVGPDGPQMAIWLIRFACWISKATNTHSDCVILIVFPLQQRLHESASMLRLTYTDSLVLNVLSPMSGCHLEVGHFRFRSIHSISLCIIMSRHLRPGAVAYARHVKRYAFEIGARKVVHLHWPRWALAWACVLARLRLRFVTF